MVVLGHNQKDTIRLETLDSKNDFPAYSLELPWGRWKTEKPCIEPPLLAYLGFSLPPSRAHSRAWYCWAGDPKQMAADREPRDSLEIVLTCCMTSRLWFMAARQRRISFVASVFPEPLSPLTEHRARASALLCLSTSTSTHEPRGTQCPSCGSQWLSSHYLYVWMQTCYPRCLDLPPHTHTPEHSLAHLMMTHWFCLASSILAKARLAIAKRCLVRQGTRYLCLQQSVSTVPRLPGVRG